MDVALRSVTLTIRGPLIELKMRTVPQEKDLARTEVRALAEEDCSQIAEQG